MLNENIRTIRKNKGFTQEELAIRLHVTRQTVSKWEKGKSVPDADLLSDMAEVLDVTVSELLGEKAIERNDQNAIIEQLSRINEQMAVRNRRASRMIRTMGILLLIVAVAVLAIIVYNTRSYKASHLASDHIGKLTYALPDSNFVHDENDIGVTAEENGRERISAKSYKMYDDMTEISIWEYRYPEDLEVLEDFRNKYKDNLVEFSDEHGELPEDIDEIVAATDQEDEYTGSYYTAYVVVGNKMYCVSVLNGSDPKGNGELLISSMRIDETLEEEYL